jgi:IS30 family transposase
MQKKEHMISPETRVQIRRYFYAEHWKIGTIARELNVHPDAVRNAVETDRFHRNNRCFPASPTLTWSSSARRSTGIRDCAPRAFIR